MLCLTYCKQINISIFLATSKVANHSLLLRNARPPSYNSIIAIDPKIWQPSFLRSRMFPLLRLRQEKLPAKRSSAEVTRFAALAPLAAA